MKLYFSKSDPLTREVGLNIGVVRTRAHRARLFLRKRLDDCMTTIPAAVA